MRAGQKEKLRYVTIASKARDIDGTHRVVAVEMMES
jgi:hypothetical protein